MYLRVMSDKLIDLGVCRMPGTEGVKPEVYERQMPSLEDGESVVVAVLPDMSPIRYDEELPGYYKAEFQVIVSSKRIKDGDSVAREVFKSLNFSNLDTGEMLIKKCKPRHLPIQYRKNKSSAYEFSTNFNIVFVDRG